MLCCYVVLCVLHVLCALCVLLLTCDLWYVHSSVSLYLQLYTHNIGSSTGIAKITYICTLYLMSSLFKGCLQFSVS